MLASFEIPTMSKFQVWYFPGCGRMRRLCGGRLGKIENKAKLSPSKAGARAELGNLIFEREVLVVVPDAKFQNPILYKA